MKKKVLITGASGFVGYHLIQAALERDLEVYAAVRTGSKIDHLKSLPVIFTFPNLGNPIELENDFKEKQYDYIIHAAGTTKANRKEDYDVVNAGYTRNLAQAVVNSGIRLQKFLFISSLAAIGPTLGTHEKEQLPNPVSSYGKSKLLAESYLADFDLPSLILRPTAVYGPRERDILLMFKLISQGLEFYIGRKDQQLSFIHVTDLANVTIDLLKSLHVKKTYNLTDGNAYDRYALGNITKEVLGKKTLKLHVPLSLMKLTAGMLEMVYGINGKIPTVNKEKLKELTAASWLYNTEDIKRDIDFSPTYDLHRGLKQTLQWYQKHKWI